MVFNLQKFPAPVWVQIIAALYANGNCVEEMLDFFRKTPLFHYNFLSIKKPGFLDTERYIELFSTYFPRDSFGALRQKLYVTTINLQKGTMEVFHEGMSIRPLLAFAALPPVFSPVEINKCLYADGGIMNNYPSEPIADNCDFLIGSNVSVVKAISRDAIRSSLQLANRTTALMIYAINNKKIARCNLLFGPQDLEQIGVLDKESMEKAYRIGYDYASRTMGHILN